jgi:hypothetical protein
MISDFEVESRFYNACFDVCAGIFIPEQNTISVEFKGLNRTL